MSHNDNNGLVGGNIPAGKACPFLDQCKFRVTRCPTAETPKSVPYSCAAARLHSMVADVKETAPTFTKLATDVLEHPPVYISNLLVLPFDNSQIVIIDDDGYTD